MKRRYYTSAQTVGEGVPAWCTAELDAESFDAARDLLIDRAERHFGGRAFRVTSVVEMPDVVSSGPIALGMRLDQWGGRRA